MSIIQWQSWLPESPEAAEAQRKANAEFAEQAEKYSDPKKLEAERLQALAGLWMKPFIAPSTSHPDSESISFDLENTDTSGKKEIPWISNAEESIIARNPDTNTELWKVQEWSEVVENSQYEESIYSPIINHMRDSGLIEYEVADELKEQLVAGLTITEAVEKSSLTPERQQEVIKSIQFAQDPKETPKRQKQFQEDFADELKEFQWNNWEWIGFGEEAFNLVSQNYIITGSEKQDVQKTLNIAFQTAANIAIDGKIIKRTESFEKTFAHVKNTDLSFKDRFLALQWVLQMTNQDQGVKGRKKAMEYQRMKKRRDIDTFEKEIQNIQYEIERAEREWNQAEKIKKLKIRQASVREELNKINTWEADIWWGELDLASEASPDTLREAA